VYDLDQVLLRVAVALGKVACDGDRPVASTGAPDRHDEVRLALGEVLRQEIIDERVQPVIEGVELAVSIDELDDPRVVAGQRPEVGLVMGVGEEAGRRAAGRGRAPART